MSICCQGSGCGPESVHFGGLRSAASAGRAREAMRDWAHIDVVGKEEESALNSDHEATERKIAALLEQAVVEEAS